MGPAIIAPDTWAVARKHLLPAIEMEPRTHDEMDVVDDLLAGRMQLWIGRKSAVITEIVDFPLCRVARVIWAGGNREEIAGPMSEAFEAWARDLGCKAAWIGGRKGWLRAAPGYSPLGVLMRKDL